MLIGFTLLLIAGVTLIILGLKSLLKNIRLNTRDIVSIIVGLILLMNALFLTTDISSELTDNTSQVVEYQEYYQNNY